MKIQGGEFVSVPLFARSQAAPSATDERELIERSLTDPEEFRPLYEHHAPAVHRYLRARADSDQDAEDLTQQVFLQAFRHLSRYRPKDGAFTPWLFGIARNAATDHHRRRRSTLSLDRLGADPATPSPEPEDARLDWLRRAVSQLDDDQRDLVALRFAGVLSVREIATVLGKSESAVQKRLSRIIHALKEQHDAHLG